MRLFIRSLGILLIIGIVASLMPIVTLYLQKDVPPTPNSVAIEKLKTNTTGAFSFIVFGDPHCGLILDDSATLKVIRRINREGRFRKFPIDFLCVLGDVALIKETAWDYRVYNKLRALSRWPVITVAGNHDDDKHGRLKLFHQNAGAEEYSFTDRGSYFIVFDNRITNPTDEQMAWLEGELKKSSTYAHRFIFTHKLPVSLYQQSWFCPERGSWAYRFMKLCEQYKVDIVFGGHEHMYRTGTYGGVRYVNTGGGILSIVPDADGGYIHYIVVRVYGDYVDYEVRRVFPPLWSYVTYYMWKEIFFFVKDIVH